MDKKPIKKPYKKPEHSYSKANENTIEMSLNSQIHNCLNRILVLEKVLERRSKDYRQQIISLETRIAIYNEKNLFVRMFSTI